MVPHLKLRTQFIKLLNCTILLMVISLFLSKSSAVFGQEPAFLRDGLVAYYPFNGNANDESGNGRNGTVEGAVLELDRFGKPNSSYRFNGRKPQRITTPQSGDFSNGMTASCWVTADPDIPSESYILGSGGNSSRWFGLRTQYNDPGTIAGNRYFFCHVSTVGGDVLLPQGETNPNILSYRPDFDTWYFVTASIGNGKIKLFVNGQYAREASVGTLSQIATGKIVIGDFEDPRTGFSWKGRIDDVRIYNRALSESDVSALYKLESQPPLSPPTISAHPQSQSGISGNAVTFSVTAAGSSSLSYQWMKNGVNISGATTSNHTLDNIQSIDAGSYSVMVTNAAGAATSNTAVLTVISPPAITSQPESQSSIVGSTVILRATATGTSTLTYQWLKDGEAISGATLNQYTINSVQTSDAGSYAVRVRNAAGTTVSNSAIITAIMRPLITLSPQTQFVFAGEAATFSVGATGSPELTYQWKKNGFAISGARLSTLHIDPAQPTDSAAYSVVVTNPAGSVISDVATLTVGPLASNKIKEPGEWRRLSAGQLISSPSTGTGPSNFWRAIPNALRNPALDYYYLTQDATKGSAQEYGQIDFEVLTSGPVWMFVLFRTGNDTAYATLQENGWHVVSRDVESEYGYDPYGNNQSFQTWMLFERTCITGETFSIRTETYQPPIILRNPSIEPDYLSSLVAYYPFNGNANDESGNSNNGTVYNAVLAPDRNGVLSSAYDFNGTSADIVIPDSPSLDIESALTVSAWIKARTFDDPLPGSQKVVILSKRQNDGWGPGYESSFVFTGQAEVNWDFHPNGVNGALYAPPIVINRWYHYTFTFSGTNLSIYMDGKLAGTTNITGNLGVNDIPVVIGRRAGEGFYKSYFDGLIDDVRIYNRALSQREVSALYQFESQPPLSPPTISAHPQSQSVISGNVVTFSVTAAGSSSLSYQWMKNGVNIIGANSNTLTINSVRSSDGGLYAVAVGNASGVTISATATLTVISPPVITVSPRSESVLEGTRVAISVVATGSPPLSYQWRKNGSNIPGATAPNYTLTSPKTTDTGSYSVVVSNAAGTVTSNTAILTVISPPTITSQPEDKSDIVGSSVTFSVTATGSSPLYYQWKKSGSDIPGATFPQYTINAVQTSDAGSYSVEARNAGGAILSKAATLAVLVPPSITTPPQSKSALVGSTVTFSVTAAGSPVLAYQWKRNGLNIPGGTSSTYQISNVQSTNTGLYSVAVSNAAGSIVSSEVTLNVHVPPSILIQPKSQSHEIGDTVTFSVTPSTGLDSLVFEWRKDGVKIEGATFSSYTISNFKTTDVGSYSVVVSNPAGSVTSEAASLTLSPARPKQNTFELSRLAFGPTQGMRIQFKPVDGMSFRIESSIDLKTWVPVISFPANTGPVEFIDSAASQLEFRYYRAVHP
ncbi:MAG: immunoglobulin domain-containing protein [Verrucomicrobia bacterium]|nr:immunoglobulin domain-containing protein [Verrucomicrobiota bacterium]